jgi:hypothetical protein
MRKIIFYSESNHMLSIYDQKVRSHMESIIRDFGNIAQGIGRPKVIKIDLSDG